MRHHIRRRLRPMRRYELRRMAPCACRPALITTTGLILRGGARRGHELAGVLDQFDIEQMARASWIDRKVIKHVRESTSIISPSETTRKIRRLAWRPIRPYLRR